ncbi:MAG: PAS domain S-box protein [Rhodospirillales bacterium]|nr:PAS domain S-box protein [Rhodospirillales bacterium]MBO6787304.1 PAS domain S-box protein [Rhodospirillales bacterium]
MAKKCHGQRIENLELGDEKGCQHCRETRSEYMLRETQRRLREAQRIAKLGSWDWDVVTGDVWWSQQIYTIFGVDPARPHVTYDVFLGFVHADDRARVEQAVDDAVNNGAPYDITHRIVQPDDTIRYVRERAEVTRDDAGKPVRMSGTVQDVTEQYLADKARKMSESRLATIIDIAPEAVVATDADGNIQIFNRGAEEIFGYRADEVRGRSLDILIPPRLRRVHRIHMRHFEGSGDLRRLMNARREISGLRKDGTEFPAFASVSKVELDEETIFIAIMRDTTELHRAEEELRNALEEARTANKAKSQFLATISHELRTPLNAILGFSEILSREFLGPLGNNKYTEYADDIIKSGELLLSLVNDLLDFSAVEQGSRVFDPGLVNLEKIAMESVRAVGEKAKQQGVRLVVTAVIGAREIYADERALRQILLNVLSNAVKFTPDGGQVSVGCETAEGKATITVVDTGVGIPEEEIPSLTQPFLQVDKDPYHSSKGWGLGLAITKSLVDLHGGELNIESVVDEGTTVTIELPAGSREA